MTSKSVLSTHIISVYVTLVKAALAFDGKLLDTRAVCSLRSLPDCLFCFMLGFPSPAQEGPADSASASPWAYAGCSKACTQPASCTRTSSPRVSALSLASRQSIRTASGNLGTDLRVEAVLDGKPSPDVLTSNGLFCVPSAAHAYGGPDAPAPSSLLFERPNPKFGLHACSVMRLRRNPRRGRSLTTRRATKQAKSLDQLIFHCQAQAIRMGGAHGTR